MKYGTYYSGPLLLSHIAYIMGQSTPSFPTSLLTLVWCAPMGHKLYRLFLGHLIPLLSTMGHRCLHEYRDMNYIMLYMDML